MLHHVPFGDSTINLFNYCFLFRWCKNFYLVNKTYTYHIIDKPFHCSDIYLPKRNETPVHTKSYIWVFVISQTESDPNVHP